MPSDLSNYLNSIPKRTREWVHQHVVPDVLGMHNKMIPGLGNRAERRKAGTFGAWRYVPESVMVPYIKPQD